jgi:hypothetical protein
MRPSLIPLQAIALGAVLGCGGGGGADVTTSPSVPGPATLRVVLRPSAPDTALARLDTAVIVEVKQDGTAKVGQQIQFESIFSAGGSPASVDFASHPQSAFGTRLTATTDDLGHASAWVRLGTDAGQSRVLVSCPALGLSDTLVFTVLPGNAASLVMSARDTALKSGDSYVVSVYTIDRNGNRRADVPAFAAGPNVTSVDASGRITVGASAGPGAAAVTAGGLLDSARFIAMPNLTMAFVNSPAVGEYSIATGETDGANLKALASATTPAYPIFSPDGQQIVYEQGKWGEAWAIYMVDGLGATRRLVDPDTVPIAQYPHFSGDGQYIYFGGKARDIDNLSVWRIRTDGTDLTQIAQVPSLFTELHVGVAPDGSRIAFAEEYDLNILDVATSNVTRQQMQATFVEFSPDSRRLAIMLQDRIRIVSFDGRAPVEVAVGRVSNDAGIAWSPDGRWLITRGYGGPVLIDVATGRMGLIGLPSVYQISLKR